MNKKPAPNARKVPAKPAPVKGTPQGGKIPQQGRPLPAKAPVKGGFGKPASSKKQNAPQKPNIGGKHAAPKPTSAAAPKASAAPINKQTAKAYNKAVNNRTRRGRKRGSRGGNYIFYYILFGIVAAVVLIVLANTVLFNCTSIVVEGNQRYTSEEIIKQSGLEKGMNLLHIDEDQAEQRIISALAYIDIADVVKVFPTKLKISVTEAETWFAVRQDGRSVTISRLGKVVQQSASHGLPVVTGIEAKLLDTGALLESEIPAKTDMPKQILEAAEKYSITGIREIDITDRFSIVLYCENEVTLQIGGVADLDSKMHEASRLFKGDKILMQNVTVNLENPEKIYVVSNVEEELIPELPENGTQEASTAQAGSPEHVSEVPAA